ncbi:MAG: site-specific integrase [Bacteroidales bacterium]|jgi:hypothetical protein|nr:site-specific integrase [Bacteroidales bacterium]
MASFSINLLHSRSRSDGKKQIVANVSAHGNALIRTGIFILDTEWDTKKRAVTGKNARIYNRALDILIGSIQTTFNMLFLQQKIKIITAKEIKQIIESGGYEYSENNNLVVSTKRPKNLAMTDEDSACFFDFIDETLARINKKKTRETYAGTKEKIRQFYESENPADSADELTFDDIDVAFVKGFDSYMEKKGLAVNSRSIYLKKLRKLYNDAIDENKASLEVYPFRKFKIKIEDTKHRDMEIEDLILLRDYACKPHQQQYIDMFFLGFYLIGINMIDLCNLTEITKSGRVEFRRSKSGRIYSIKMEPEALEVINKYRGKKYLIDVMERYGDYANYLHMLNKNLKEIGADKQEKKKQKQPFSHLSWYYARHTWATIAAELDIPDDIIKMALGHGKKTITDIYIKRNQKKVDDANRQVIDYLNNYKKENQKIINLWDDKENQKIAINA